MSIQESMAIIAITSILFCGFANSATYTVGRRWGFDMHGWPNGAKFQTGDVLEFIYNASNHDVWIVYEEQNFKSCIISGTKMNSGDDLVILPKGKSFFICGFPGHCENGVKVEVEAE